KGSIRWGVECKGHAGERAGSRSGSGESWYGGCFAGWAMQKIAAFVWTDRSSPTRRRAIENHFDRAGYTLVRLRAKANDGPLELPAWLRARDVRCSGETRLVVVTDKGEWTLGWFRAFNRLADDFVWLV